jgi:flagellar motor switch protein FliM
MSGDREIRPFDFRKSRQVAAAPPGPLAEWHQRVCELANEAWSKHVDRPIRWELRSSEPVSFAGALQIIPDPGLGALLAVGDPPMTTLWTFSQSQALFLISEMLGNRETDWPAARPLTLIEESMLQLLFAELAWAIGEAWPGRASIACRVGDLDRRPARSRHFIPQQQLVGFQFSLTGAVGEATCHWFMPNDPLQRMIAAEWPPETGKAGAPSSQHIEQIAGALPLTMIACLGRADVPMSQLARLQLGDVIVLEQSIREPISLEVQGISKFRALPGRIGAQQSVQITGVSDREQGAA